MANVVKGDFGVDPGVVFYSTLPHVVDLSDGQAITIYIDAFVEPASEELNPHDGKDQPEYQAHQEHVENGRDSVHQGIDNNLEWCTLGTNKFD